MRFQVPQFIDVEDKIFGPFTLKQFIYLAGAASVGLITVTFFGIFWGLLLASPIIALALALAFYKINNRPFINVLESAFKFVLNDKLYIWKKSEELDPTKKENVGIPYSSIVVPNLSKGKLKDLHWELDVKKNEGGEKIL